MNGFDKIIGYDAVKEELYQIIDIFKNVDLYKSMGAKLPKGVLLHGQPGLGKTMLAKALIEECDNVNSYYINKNKSKNDSINEIREVFEKAKENTPSIILIDDIDKFSDESNDFVDDEAFVAIQSGIDSVKEYNVLVVATANNCRKLPESLVRNGRFDRKIAIKPPTDEDARKIIEFYMKDKKVDKDLNYEDVSKMISYTSCADLETILNESAVHAVYARKDLIDINDIIKAYLRDQYSTSDDKYKCSKEQLDATSIHEAGHAVIAEVLKEGSVGFVSINTSARSGAEGFTSLSTEFKRRPENVLIALGGKAASELFYEGRCGSGCQSDLNKAYNLVMSGIRESGTRGIGLLCPDSNSSSNLDTRIETAVQAELERYFFLAKSILLKNKDLLMKINEKLREKKILLYSDLKKIRSEVKITKFEIE